MTRFLGLVLPSAGVLLSTTGCGSFAEAHPLHPSSAPVAQASPSTNAAAAEAVVDAFHNALESGQREAALALLADDVLILEGGGAERSKAEYAAHHLDADIAFTRAVPSKATRRSSGGDSTTAWVASEARLKGIFNGRPIDTSTAETMVLKHLPEGWRIVHIHWSSGDAD